MQLKIAAALIFLATPALADPTFTKDEAEAVYTLGVLNAGAEQAQNALKSFAASPAAKSALAKMSPPRELPKSSTAPTPPAAPKKP